MAELIRHLARAVDRHWFAPASLHDLALVRIIVFGAQSLVFLWIPIGRLLSPADQVRVAEVSAAVYQPVPVLKLLLLPWGAWGQVQPTAELIIAAYAVATIAGILAAAGLLARASMLVTAATHNMLVAHWYSYGEYHHAEALMMVALVALALSPCANVWSLDAVIRRRPRGRVGAATPSTSVFARWPLRMMQWMIVLTYLSAAYSKITVGGLAWYNGHTMTYKYAGLAVGGTREMAFTLATLPPAWHIPGSVATILFELGFVSAILWPRIAWAWIVTGVLFHLTVYVTMEIAFFQTLLLYVAFLGTVREHPPRLPSWMRRDSLRLAVSQRGDT